MSDKKNKPNFLTMRNAKGKKKLNKGFIAAMTICLIAVGAAGITTYRNINNYVNPPEEEIRVVKSSQELSSDDSVNANHNVSGVFDSDRLSSHIPHTADIDYGKPTDTDAGTTMMTDSDTASETDSSATDSAADTADDTTTDTSGEPIVSDTYLYPVGKEITKEFSGDKLVYSETMNDWRIHSGCDFYAEKGEKVKPITTGTVTQIYDDPLLGVTVVIDHGNGITAYYSGLGSTTLVNVGDRIEIGDFIGSVNVVPCESTEQPHLHLAIKSNDEWIDPMGLFDTED